METDIISGAMSAFEHSALGRAARSTTWLYPLANLVHVLGAALLVGAIVAFDVQVLRRRHEDRIVYRATIPIAALGLVLQIASGIVLLSAEASTIILNPAFLFKLAWILIGLANVALFYALFGSTLRHERPLKGARPLAAVSLVAWIAVLLSGRAIAYL